jgi:putative sterol carrier protein
MFETANSEVPFLSQAWFDAYRERIETDEEYNRMSTDWGVGFDGDLLFEMTSVPVDDLDEDAMPDDLAAELDQYLSADGTGQAVLGLEGGECTRAELIEPGEDPDVGFVLLGDFDAWVDLVNGDIGAVDGIMSGKPDLDGDMQKILQYSDSASRLTELAEQVDDFVAAERYS